MVLRARLGGAATIHKVSDDSKNREVEGGIDAKGHAKKSAEGRGHRFVSNGSYELRDFKPRRKNGEYGGRDGWLILRCKREREKPQGRGKDRGQEEP